MPKARDCQNKYRLLNIWKGKQLLLEEEPQNTIPLIYYLAELCFYLQLSKFEQVNTGFCILWIVFNIPNIEQKYFKAFFNK